MTDTVLAENATPMIGRDAIPELLSRSGTSVVFSMLAETNGPWIASGVERGLLRLVKTRHEETSVNAAVGYARSTGKVGIASVTRGPGFANAINALIAARHSHVPILLVVAEGPATGAWTEQSIDQRGFANVIGAGFHHVGRPDELPSRLTDAMRRAVWNGCPQILSIGDGTLEAKIQLPDSMPELSESVDEPDHDAVSAAIDLLERSHKPLLLAGQGAVLAGARAAMEELAALTGARLANTLRANRMFSGHPQDIGLCGTWSPPIVRDLLAETDAVVAVGASLNQHTTDHRAVFGGAPIIHCEVDPDQPFMASSPELALLGDGLASVQALIREWNRRELAPRDAPMPPPTRAEISASLRAIELGHDEERGLDIRSVYHAFDEKLPKNRIVVNDSGRAMSIMPSMVDAPDARSWLVGRGHGSVGLGLGTAIGAAVAHPDRQVALFLGDGAFMMAQQDLDAARIAGLDLLVVILNDEQYGSEVPCLLNSGLPLDIIRQSLPDIELLARAFGGQGFVVRNEDDLRNFEIPESGITLVDVRTDPEANASALG